MSAAPVALRSNVILAKIHEAARVGKTDRITRGIYGSGGSNGSILGYVKGFLDRHGSYQLSCSLPVNKIYGNIAVDRRGDLLVIGAVRRSGLGIIVFAGPGLCGSKLGSIADPYGTPRDVTSRDAQGGRIVIGNDPGADGKGHGGVSVCTLSGGCSANLTTPHMEGVEGVVLAPNGDCWGLGHALLIGMLAYFAHCQGHGVAATGFQSYSPGGLDIDADGNLVSVDRCCALNSHLSIYSGCNPACQYVGGPFQLHGYVEYGHLDASSKHFVAADLTNNQLDVYSYSTSGVRYEYGVSNLGMYPPLNGAAFSPSSRE